MLQVDGRIVVSGMGKSGHVAGKIAATLASTGTPALYVHPGEASHGDLGMITKQDAVLALSNSGNTPELSDIVAYCRRYGIALIGITSAAASPLAEQADIALILPKAPEACPMGLAPTTSTTMMMALGDALAIALLERRGFSAQDFQVFHPGGTLGSKLLRVSEVMQSPAELPLCRESTAVAEALLIMTQSSGELRSFGCVGIVDDDRRLIGLISDGDLRRHMEPTLLERSAGDVMTANPKTIRPQAPGGRSARLHERDEDHQPLRGGGRAPGRFPAYARLPARGRRLRPAARHGRSPVNMALLRRSPPPCLSRGERILDLPLRRVVE